MNIRSNVLLILLIAIIGCKPQNKDLNSFLSGSDRLVLTTTKQSGFGSFPKGFSELNNNNRVQNSPWQKMYPNYIGIPDSLTNLTISTNPINWEQFVFQSYKSGKADSSFFNTLLESWEMDTTKLYSKEIKTFFSLAIGQNSKGEWVYVLDKNNNLDFSDDKIKMFKKQNPNLRFSDEELPDAESIVYETFDGRNVNRDSSLVYLFQDYFASNCFVFFEYRVTNFEFDGNNYRIKIKSPSNSLDYSKYSEVGISKINDGINNESLEKYLVKIGEYLILDDAYFKIDKITSAGDSIFLSRDLNAEKQGGTQLGMKAIDFSSLTIDNQELKLSEFKGKYVILDFWGTWCKPCIAEIPTLKKVNELFGGKNLVMIGIANDTKQKLLQFLENEPLPWVQIPQYIPDNDSILKMYKINSFPSTFIIDPSGRIIYKNLKGSSLIYKLEQLLYPIDSLKERALKGNTKFELIDYKDADLVYARVYSEDNPQNDWTVMMYWMEGKWIGSVDLKPGSYTYEFSIDDDRMKDPKNNESKYAEIGDREISILKIK